MGIKVKCLYSSPLFFVSNAIRFSRDTFENSDSVCNYTIGKKDLELIKRVGVKHKHESVLEFCNVIWSIKAPRYVHVEFIRHRLQNITAKSSRYTIKKDLKKEKSFLPINSDNIERAKKYIALDKNKRHIETLIPLLEEIRLEVLNDISNDKIKRILPEAWWIEWQTQMNLRVFMNFLKLRLAKDALMEIRQVAYAMFDSIPDESIKEVILEEDEIKEKLRSLEEEMME